MRACRLPKPDGSSGLGLKSAPIGWIWRLASSALVLSVVAGCAPGLGETLLANPNGSTEDQDTNTTDIEAATNEVTDAVREQCPRLADAKIDERIDRVLERRRDGENEQAQIVFWTTPPLQCDPDELCPGFLTESCPPCERCWVAIVTYVYSLE